MDFFANKKLLQEHLVNLTKDLIRFPSHPDEPIKIFELVEFIKEYFKNDKVNIQSFTSGGFPSLVITLHDTKHPEIILSGHLDVVPSSNRYSALEEGKILYGSGALDMKGGVAVIMAILKFFSTQEALPSLAIMLTSDEEIGSEHGTRMLLEDEGYRANFVIINEGRRKYEIVIREKGILILKLVSHGNFIHSAYPWLGKNALEELIKAIITIKKIFPKPGEAWTPTATVTSIHSGKEENTIPNSASAIINIRLTGGLNWTKEVILKKIKKKLPKHIEIAHEIFGEIFITDQRDEHIQLLHKVAESVLRRKMNFAENHGASDAKIFMEHGIPLAILGPVGKNHHSPDESLEIDSLVDHFEVLKKFIETEHNYFYKTI